MSLWIIVAIAGVGSIATVASFRFAEGEAHALQDETLKQVGALIRRIPPAVIDQAGIFRPSPPSSEAVAVVRLRDDAGGLCGATQGIALPCGLGDGLHTVMYGGERWRVWVVSGDAGLRFAVAQPTALRDEIARDGSLRTLVPLLCLMVALMMVVAWVVRRSFKPITQLAEALDRAGRKEIGTLPTAGMPSEIEPFIVSINRLLHRLGEALEQQRRFVADAAHELRSPLTALTLQAQNLDTVAMAPAARERVDELRVGLKRSSRLVSQLLSLARLQQGAADNHGVLWLADIVRQVVGEALDFAESKRIDLGADRLERLGLPGDRLAVQTALRNLVDNAIRYTPAQGRVDIRVYADGTWACIEVEDNGPGMTPDDLGQACRPFFRATQTAETGSGLGLAIANDLARSMGGELQLHAPGTGLLVRLRLPGVRAG
ncbi:ATP-binding protein [Dyella sp. EPa41]|uniref:ATP-binding protein n=1 Tax=Dyella sp. EPa41 TaxID=1561194 RepID=UPI0019162D76|nr:ATP-binding protein [Dyella sp. EPa41]